MAEGSVGLVPSWAQAGAHLSQQCQQLGWGHQVADGGDYRKGRGGFVLKQRTGPRNGNCHLIPKCLALFSWPPLRRSP